MMDWNGQRVNHPIFGAGTVAALEQERMTVAFAAGEKKFAYPMAFAQFLTAESPEAQEEAQSALAQKRAADATARAEKARRQEAELEGRRAAFAEERRATRKTTRRTAKK